jgi:hypothetical protein
MEYGPVFSVIDDWNLFGAWDLVIKIDAIL